ncbi:glycosyltransferase family 2 protein [Candidatus Microgenomates bacterium]|nr:glycosyltransferase family 2 protein [Candidatus Microgenomates bacterium]
MKKVFVIIVNWNRVKDTLDCLISLDKITTKDLNINLVVVDNGSTDNSVKQIKNYFSKSKLRGFTIEVGKNLGFAEGNNIGIEFALANGADYIMLLNNDTYVDKDLIINLVVTLEKDKAIGVVSPKIYFAPGFEFHKDRYNKTDLGKVIWYAGGVVDWNNVYGLTYGVDEVDQGQFDKLTETDFANGACLLIPRNVLEKTKGFDEKFFMYYEDTDLSQRIKKLGYKVVYDPSGIVWHKVSQSSGIGSNLNDYFISRNRMIFGMRYAKLRTKFALFRESIKLLFIGRKWQRIGIRDYFLRNFEKGSWK